MKSLFLALAATFGLAFSAATADAQISVSGTGRVAVKPDYAVIQLSVITDGNTATQASTANKTQAAALITALTGLGVADKDVQTCGFAVSPKYTQNKTNNDYVLSGYQAVNSLRVNVRDLDKVGKVLDLAGTANRVSGISWEVNDRSKLADKAREEAFADAKRKATLYATQAGVQLGQLQSLSEGGYNRPVYAAASMRSESAVADVGVPVAPGEVEISVNVNVTYFVLPQAVPPVAK